MSGRGALDLIWRFGVETGHHAEPAKYPRGPWNSPRRHGVLPSMRGRLCGPERKRAAIARWWPDSAPAADLGDTTRDFSGRVRAWHVHCNTAIMPIPLRITFRGMTSSEAVEQAIRDRVDKLERFVLRITDCRVVVHAPHRHRHTGEIYTVRIDLRIPGAEIVVNRDAAVTAEHNDVYVAIRDAFDAARRKLEDAARRRRGDVKSHDVPLWGRLARLDSLEGFGFIESADGLEVYFHEHALVGAHLADLRLGDEVRFTLSDGNEGPQASNVQPVGKHHVVERPMSG
jgi:cold shock CspA family protein/ribosome-associated translation inhibitor RaiA